MARIEPPSKAPLWIKGMMALCRRMYGRVLGPLQIAAHVPSFMLPYMMTNRISHAHGTLSPDIRLLAMQLVGEINGCNWCVDFGRGLASDALRNKIYRVREYETAGVFSPEERAALRYAAETARVPVHVSDETFAELRCHFDERQIVELTFAVAIESFYNRINAPLEVEAEGFCAIPVPHPAPAARGSVWANRPS